jgi:hypothetical protein
VFRWAKARGIPVRRFAKRENKEEIARPLIEAAEREGGDGRAKSYGCGLLTLARLRRDGR